MAKTIAVTGKGGTGKTVVAALIVKWLKENATGAVLAMDADPDANLATVLGMQVERTVGDLREETAKEIRNLPPGMSKSAYIEAGLHEVVVEGKKVDLITMGRSEGPGCYCYVNNLLRDFSDRLQSAYAWIVTDNEAGLEHLSRRTASRIDHLIVAINASPLSLDCAVRIDALTRDLSQGVGRKSVLVNDVTDERKVRLLQEKADRLAMEFLGAIPHDAVVEDAVFEGRSLFTLDETPAVATMGEILSRLLPDATG
jgi:CO dehydrogenase maturation factor